MFCLKNFAFAATTKPLLIASLMLVAAFPACTFDVHDRGRGGQEHVDIQSPVGNLHVSKQADVRDAGLSIYPGAKAAPKDNGDDEKNANVNLDLPGFSLKVVAAEFLSDDAQDKIVAYYNKELTTFGKPIQCHGEWHGGSVDSPDSDRMSKPVSCHDGSGDSVELKVGTEGNQHIVAIKPSGRGTRFALVYVRVHAGKDDTI